MMTEEDYRLKQGRRTTIRAFLPLFGLILIIAFGAIAFIFGASLTDLLVSMIPSIASVELTTLDWISRAIIFLALVMVATLIYSIAIPKKKDIVTERALEKERKDRMEAQKQEKLRQRQVKAKMAKERAKNDPLR
jgi:predicted histidine transporter YuiF (NhaC family)